MTDKDEKPVTVPLSLLLECFNQIGDCLCFPSGLDLQDNLLERLDSVIEKAKADGD